MSEHESLSDEFPGIPRKVQCPYCAGKGVVEQDSHLGTYREYWWCPECKSEIEFKTVNMQRGIKTITRTRTCCHCDKRLFGDVRMYAQGRSGWQKISQYIPTVKGEEEER